MFRRLLESHFEGVITHATYRISAGKLERINNKIKTLRRQGYGYPSDDYLFLKFFNASRKACDRNPKSHKKMIDPNFYLGFTEKAVTH